MDSDEAMGIALEEAGLALEHGDVPIGAVLLDASGEGTFGGEVGPSLVLAGAGLVTVLPLLATEVFELTAFTATLTFIAAFGIVKAATNFVAGTLSDRYGRKPVLIAGWLFAVPVPVVLIWAPETKGKPLPTDDDV